MKYSSRFWWLIRPHSVWLCRGDVLIYASARGDTDLCKVRDRRTRFYFQIPFLKYPFNSKFKRELNVLPPITKTIQVWRTRHAGHCWRSRDELIRDVLLWTPTHGRAKAGRPARTYIQQLCEDTGCCPEDLPRAMNDREEWRERVRYISATSAIWWWWWWYYRAIHSI